MAYSELPGAEGEAVVFPHSLMLDERASLHLTGVLDVAAFDDGGAVLCDGGDLRLAVRCKTAVEILIYKALAKCSKTACGGKRKRLPEGQIKLRGNQDVRKQKKYNGSQYIRDDEAEI